MALLTVDYAYRLDGPSWPELSGTFYIFGQWGTQSTRDFLLDLFRVRHKDSILIDLNLQNSQP